MQRVMKRRVPGRAEQVLLGIGWTLASIAAALGVCYLLVWLVAVLVP